MPKLNPQDYDPYHGKRAVMLLIDAYRNAQDGSGQIEWEDLNHAFAEACLAFDIKTPEHIPHWQD